MAKIEVSLVNGKHKCVPTRSRVKEGEEVRWDGSTVPKVRLEPRPNIKDQSLPAGPPFKEGAGPLSTSDPHTVNSKPPLKSGDRFEFADGIEGDIVID